MRRITVAHYLLPPGPGRRAPYLSSWKMTEQEAADRGALEIVPGTAEARDIPESEEEHRRAMAHYQSAGRDGAAPPKG